ncbi:MAG TPA: glycoside hydrolase family 97 N-terminal domain-containing protein [Vicinamibacteria bacterium]|nr:glycoside hydrolase family 97 N-terminal domain-containing protein [Vicinamibacteria bacterium]
MQSKSIRSALTLAAALAVWAVVPAEARPQDARATEPPRSDAAQQRAQEERLRSGERRSRRVLMERVRVASPDGRIELTVLPNAERLSFTVSMDGRTVVDPSPVQMSVDGFDLGAGLTYGGVEEYALDETYPWHGAHATAKNRCRGARISLVSDLGMIPFVFDVRVFDDGVAYRHVVPGEAGATRIPDERSAFVLPEGATVWFHDLDGHYESAYEERDVSAVPPGQWAGPPLTFELPQGRGYGSISEANLVDYSGMALEADGRRGFVVGLGHRQPINWPYELRYGREEAKRLGRAAAVTGTITTPWRVVMLGRDLNALVNSDILPNLCPPADERLFPQGMNTPWVEPGLAVWRYVDGGDDSFEGLKGFSEMGARLGAKYHIIEGVWRRWSDAQVREIVEYSRKLGIRLLFWKHSRQLRTPAERDAFFAQLEGAGVGGAKIDFFDHEGKQDIDLYEDLLRRAAEKRMVLNFHGANKPTGRLRTWPNELVREAVRGMESRSLLERARHETILPFTRYLAGPADYTTMVFGERRADTTWAHQIASLATFHSPLLTIAAHPQSVLDNPALEVIKSITPVWDETIVLPPSRIGRLSAFARRKGDMWMLAVMAGSESAALTLPLSFLADGPYEAALVRDVPGNPAAVRIENATLERDGSLTLEMAQGGGFVARFRRR